MRTDEIVRDYYHSEEEAEAWRYPLKRMPREYGLPMSEFRMAQVYFAPGHAVLAVGCGAGREVLPLSEAGFQVIGVDASVPMLETAVANLGGLVRPFLSIAAEAARLPVRSRSVRNTLMAGGVIHSIAGARNRLAALQELRRVLHPAGSALVHYWRVPLVPELQSLVAPLWLARTVRLLVGALIALIGSCTNVWRRISWAFGGSSPEPGDAVFPRGRRLTYRHHYTRGGLERDLRAVGFESVTYVPSTPIANHGPRNTGHARLRHAVSKWLNGESGYFVCRLSAVSHQQSASDTEAPTHS